MQKQKMMFKQKEQEALTLGDAVPAIVALALIAIVGAVALLILTNFQSNPVTTPGLAGGSGSYGLFIETNSIVLNGNIVANSPNVVPGQASGGAGVVVTSFNALAWTGTGTIFHAAGTGGDQAGGAGTNTVNILISGAPIIPFATSATACGNNLVSTGATGCTGNDIYTQSVTLTGSVNVTGNIIVTNGVTLTTNGWTLVAASNVVVQSLGLIVTGVDTYTQGAAGTQTTNGLFGAGNTLSFGGTGAGGTGCFTTGGRGGNTLSLGAAGGAAGATCTAGTVGVAGIAVPTLTSSNIPLYAAGQSNVLAYLSGAAAGGSSPQYSASYNGLGQGVTGISTVLSFQSLLGLVIIAAIIIGIVVGAFAFGRGGGSTREEF